MKKVRHLPHRCHPFDHHHCCCHIRIFVIIMIIPKVKIIISKEWKWGKQIVQIGGRKEGPCYLPTILTGCWVKIKKIIVIVIIHTLIIIIPSSSSSSSEISRSQCRHGLLGWRDFWTSSFPQVKSKLIKMYIFVLGHIKS